MARRNEKECESARAQCDPVCTHTVGQKSTCFQRRMRGTERLLLVQDSNLPTLRLQCTLFARGKAHTCQQRGVNKAALLMLCSNSAKDRNARENRQ